MFFIPEVNEAQFCIDAEETRHITKVLRKNVGDTIEVTNGKGELFTAKIVSIDKKQCLASVISKTSAPNNAPELCMAVAPTKNIDRYEWFIEKAVEIGVRRIVPIICDHSERTTVNRERLVRIAVSAMKQSQSLYLPEITEQMSFDSCLKTVTGLAYLAFCPVQPSGYISIVVSCAQPATIFIGPEGDFSEREFALTNKLNIPSISLGPTRLRTETAAVYACTIFQSLWHLNNEY